MPVEPLIARVPRRRRPHVVRVCPPQIHPLTFLGCLRWIDGRPLLAVMERYRQQILTKALTTLRPDGSLQFRRILTGRGKKNSKTTDAVLVGLYFLLAWKAAGSRGNQVYFVASDLGQAHDDLDLCKKLVKVNPILEAEVTIKSNLVERKDGRGFIEILPANDVQGLHGKTYLCLVVDELHTQRDYRVLEALEIDRTRPDATQWFASYASLSRHAGVPLVDLQKQSDAQTDPRLYVSWYSGTIAEANPSLNGPLGPTMAGIEDAQRSLPSWMFRRLYLNLPGQPDAAAFDADIIESRIVTGRTVLPPMPGVSYVAFVDMSGGGNDDATLAIAHADSQGRAVLDLVMDQGPRTGKTFSPDATVKQFDPVLKTYNHCRKVVGDNYAKAWPQEAFTKLGIQYEVSDKNRSQIYASFEPLLNSGRIELLDRPKLTQQLIGLVRKGEKIDHENSEHDDWSNSAAGALVLCTHRQATATMIKISGF